MGRPAKQVEREALELPQAERSRLVIRLLESLDETPGGDPVTNEKLWVQEAARRYEAHLRGDDPAISAEEVFAELRKGGD